MNRAQQQPRGLPTLGLRCFLGFCAVPGCLPKSSPQSLLEAAFKSEQAGGWGAGGGDTARTSVGIPSLPRPGVPAFEQCLHCTTAGESHSDFTTRVPLEHKVAMRISS